MKISNALKAGAGALVALLGLTACATNESGGNNQSDAPTEAKHEVTAESKLSGSIVGVGASSQGEAQNAWIASFLDVQADINVAYDPAGSGAGRENFQQGASEFAGSDRAFKLEELSAGPFAACAADTSIIQLPLYVSPIAVIFNVDGLDSLNLDADTLAAIFTGKITNWNDEAVAKQNPDVELPDLAITPVHRADKSGTTGNFTDYLAAAAPDTWSFGSVEEWPLNAGEAAPQTSGMINAVEGGKGTIGYADASRVGDLSTVDVLVGDEYVPYSPEAAAAVLDASELETGRAAGDLAINLDRNTSAAGVYPIVLVSYLIGCATYADPAKAPLVQEYFKYMASETGQAVAETNAGSAPISDELRKKVNEAIATIS